MNLKSTKIKELSSLLEHINTNEFKESLKNNQLNSEDLKELENLNAVIEKHYFKSSIIEKKISEYNDTVLKFAQHNYSFLNELDSENDLLNSLGLSINLLGEELNYSTVTTYYLDDIFNSMKDLLIVIDKQGFIHSVNNASLAILKYDKNELIKTPISTIFEDDINFDKLINNTLSEKTYFLISKDKHKIPVLLSISHFVRGDEQEIGTVIIARDMSSKLKAEKAIQESENKFRSLIENSADVISLIDINGNVIYNSPSYNRLMGYDEKLRVGKNIFELVHPDEYENIKQLFAKIIRRPDRVTIPPTRIRHADNTWRWIEGVASNLLNEPSVNAIVVNYRNITERILTEEKLRESENRFRKIYEDGPLGMVLVNKDYCFTKANSTFCKMMGYNEDEIKNLTFKDITHPDYLANDSLNVQKLIEGKISIYKTEKKYIRKDKKIIWGALTATINYSNEGKLVFTLAMVEDITERKQAEEALRFYSYAFSGSQDAIIISDIEFKVKNLNPAAESLYGWKTEEMLGHNITEFVKQEYIGFTRETVISDFFKYGYWRGEVIQTKRNGSNITVLATVSLIKDLNGKSIGVLASNRDISDIKKTEESLRILSNRNEAILDSVPDIIMEVDNNKVYTWANKEGFSFYGNDVIGKEAAYYFEGEQKTYNIIEPLLKGDKDLIYVESCQRRQDGDKRLLAWWCRTLKDENGKVTGVLSSAQDITDRRLVEEAVKESEKKYRLITDNINDLVWIMDLGLKSVYISPSCLKILGYTAEERQKMPTKKIFTPESYQKILKLFNSFINKLKKDRLREKDLNIKIEVEQVRKDGTTFWAESNVGAYYDDNGKIVGIQGVTRDISERKKAEQILREKEESFRLMLENLPIPVGAYNINNNKIIFFNSRFKEVFGYGIKELKTLNEWFDISILNKSESTKIKNIWEKAITVFQNKQIHNKSAIEISVLCKNGTVKFIEISFTIDKNTVFVVFNDITERRQILTNLKRQIGKRTRDLAIANEQLQQELNERKKQEIKLLYSEYLNSTTINAINDYILVLDAELKVIMYNDAIKKYFRLTRSDKKSKDIYIIGKKLSSVFSEFDKKILNKYDEIIENCRGFMDSFEVVLNKRTFFLEIKTIPLISDGKVVKIVTSVHDISKLKQVEEEIKLNLQREKELNMLKTRFISVVSHEFRNPLASILSSIQLFERYRNKLDEEKMKSLFTGIYETIRYSDLLLDDLSIIGKHESGKLELNVSICNLNMICNQSIGDIKASHGDISQIKFSITSEINNSLVDKSLLRHVLNNVLSNAIKYSDKTKPIIFDVGYNDNNIVFTVEDEGRGIPEKDIKYIFDPFHRASNVESIKGTGLGLAIVKRCVEMHNGTIQLKSQLNKGTTVIIKIPHKTEDVEVLSEV